jgi:hypothetical protein
MSHTTPMPQPRDIRRFPRFRITDAKILVYPEGFLQSLGLRRANRAVAAINLSEGGILVQLGREVAPETTFRLRLELERFSEVIEGKAIVRWCGPSRSDVGVFYAGLEFVKIDPVNRRKIEKMRGWFTSKEYRVREKVKARED